MPGKFIIESFWQKAANCVSVVLIKAAILQYGLNRVFNINKKNDHYIITLKNKHLLILSGTEIKRISKQSKLNFRQPRDKNKKKQVGKLKAYVNLCFAVIVRNLQLHGYNGKEYTESKAIEVLTKEGLETDHMHSLLGLSRKTRAAHKLTQSHLHLFKSKKAVLLYSDRHIVVASGGYYDDFGKARKLDETIPTLEGRKANRWFELK